MGAGTACLILKKEIDKMLEKNVSAKVSVEFVINLSPDLVRREYEKSVLVELFNLASKTEEDIKSWMVIADCVDMLGKLPITVEKVVFSRQDILFLRTGFKNSTTNLKAQYLIMRNDSWVKEARELIKQIASFEV
jgi:hypothetical protein